MELNQSSKIKFFGFGQFVLCVPRPRRCDLYVSKLSDRLIIRKDVSKNIKLTLICLESDQLNGLWYKNSIYIYASRYDNWQLFIKSECLDTVNSGIFLSRFPYEAQCVTETSTTHVFPAILIISSFHYIHVLSVQLLREVLLTICGFKEKE